MPREVKNVQINSITLLDSSGISFLLQSLLQISRSEIQLEYVDGTNFQLDSFSS